MKIYPSLKLTAGAVSSLLVLAVACSPPEEGSPKAASASMVASRTLEASDPRFDGGEHYDVYPLTAELGEQITVDLVSRDFDPYLVLESPSGVLLENDDHEGSAEHSRLEVDAAESGTWQVYATSYEAGELGEYRLTIETAPSARTGRRYERGTLADGDDELTGGELSDRVTFSGEQGEYVWIDLRSAEFDPYLILVGPAGEQWESDDYEGSLGRSVLGLTLPQAGEYRVLVTSAAAGETGAWDLTLQQGLWPKTMQRTEQGELAAGDERMRQGELVDEYRIEGVAGQQVRLGLSSDDFDTYLILVDPEGRHVENDDDGSGGSSIRSQLRVPGTHRVLVTSYAPGETGGYTLELGLGEVRPVGPVDRLEIGGRRSGDLGPGDEELPAGEYIDRYAVSAEAGTAVEIVLSSNELDPYLVLVMPDGSVMENDDDWDDASRSRLALTLPQSGGYEVNVTSSSPGETGAYLLELHHSSAQEVPPVRGMPNRTFAVLVGISDYGSRLSDLENTAQDARQLHRALVRRAGVQPEDTVLLLDREATAARVRESIATLAARMTAADQLVVFYSGHGDRVRRESFQPADPDSVDETLSLYDGEISDDELAAALDAVPGRSLLILDSCFAGGFAKDVIAAPGRMGIFSSEEDVTSSVAEKFRAGGFLAAFLVDALEGDRADDGDGHLTALELSHYLHERYRTDVKGGGPDDFVRAGGPLLGYQRLVVDRGSLGPADVLFRLQAGAAP